MCFLDQYLNSSLQGRRRRDYSWIKFLKIIGVGFFCFFNGNQGNSVGGFFNKILNFYLKKKLSPLIKIKDLIQSSLTLVESLLLTSVVFGWGPK